MVTASAAVLLAALLSLSCNGSRSADGLQGNQGPGALDLLAPGFRWTASATSPIPISIPARAGSPLLSEGWSADDHLREGESCVLSSGPSAGIYLPFWPGGEGRVRVRLNIQVIDGEGDRGGGSRPRIVVDFNGQPLFSRPIDSDWFPLSLAIPASRFHQGENEIVLTVKSRREGSLEPTESARLAFSGIQLTLPRVETGLLLGRVQQQALVTAGPLVIDLPAALPAGAELRYAVAQMPWFASAADGAVISRISARAFSGKKKDESSPCCSNEHRVGTDLLSTTSRAAGCRWRHHRLPLADLAGKRVRLELEGETTADPSSAPPLHAWGSLVLTWPVEDRAETRPYNVIVILADTLRADRLGSGGADGGFTPHLDRLSHRAVVFQDTAAQASSTYPSMCSMFSGDYYTHISKWAQLGHLPPEISVLGEVFSSNGFHTVGIVGNPLLRPEAGFARGFRRYDNSMIVSPAPKINERFFQWLPMLAKTRFFAYLHYMDIHAPYWSPDYPQPKMYRSGRLKGQRWEGGLPAVTKELIEHGQCSLDQADRMVLVEQYDEGIRFWDRQLGHLLAGLEKCGILSHTVIVVIADHGEEFFEHGLAGHGQSLYRELVHVPALILFPPASGIRQPQQVTRPVELLDILPTLCEFLELPPADEHRGTSRLSILREAPGSAPPGPVIREQPRIFETRSRAWKKPPFNDFLSGIHHHRWKLIHNRWTGEDQLFDLFVDPQEAIDLAGDRPDKVEELQGMVNALLDLTVAGPASEAKDRREREALEALGYIQ